MPVIVGRLLVRLSACEFEHLFRGSKAIGDPLLSVDGKAANAGTCAGICSPTFAAARVWAPPADEGELNVARPPNGILVSKRK